MSDYNLKKLTAQRRFLHTAQRSRVERKLGDVSLQVKLGACYHTTQMRSMSAYDAKSSMAGDK